MITPEETAELACWQPISAAPRDGTWIIGEANKKRRELVAAVFRCRWEKHTEPELRGWYDFNGVGVEPERWLEFEPAARRAEAKDARIAELEEGLRIVALERYVVGTIVSDKEVAKAALEGRPFPSKAKSNATLREAVDALRPILGAARLADPSPNAGGGGA